MNQKDIENLIKFVQKSGVSEVSIEQKDFKITIKTQGNTIAVPAQQIVHMPTPMPVAAAPSPAASAAPAPVVQPAAEKVADSGKLVTVKSPMIGTFYRSSSPDKPPFVTVGDEVKPGKMICVIEAMKLFNEIECEVSGKIVKVLVDNASPVEYDQPLFLVDPS